MVNTDVVIKQKRGRKPKNATTNKVSEEKIENLEDQSNDNNIIFSIEETKDNENNVILSNQEESKPVGGKKRGRKPKGGKIIQQIAPLNNNTETKPNVILHLKCSLKELQTSMVKKKPRAY